MRKRKKRLGCSGATLVELIVAFALLGIFLVSAAAVTGSCFRMFTRIREYAGQRMVCASLMDTIEFELGAAREEICISAEGQEISYKNSEDQTVLLKMEEQGYLGVEEWDGEGEEFRRRVILTQEAYGQNRIQSLTFEPLENRGGVCLVKATMVLESAVFEGMTCKTTRVVHCYNIAEGAFDAGLRKLETQDGEAG